MDFDIALMFIVALVLVLVPAFVARSRGHRNTPAIAALCILLGWSGIGWIIALVWALTDNTEAAS